MSEGGSVERGEGVVSGGSGERAEGVVSERREW